ncbi:MAG: DoxX family membrane protein [Candidatus Latescibacterota bacterium]
MVNRDSALPQYSTVQLTSLVILRVLIGWHFLYEGIAKLISPHWTAASYLMESKWIFSGMFTWMASNPAVLALVDFMNIWGLIAIGLGLIVGGLTRIASIAGVLLLLLYYICNPPFIGYTYSMPMEGSYLIVSKNLIELFSLIVLIVFPTGSIIGIDRLLKRARGTIKKKTPRD